MMLPLCVVSEMMEDSEREESGETLLRVVLLSVSEGRIDDSKLHSKMGLK
jgi:hypothetical protein